MCKDTALLDCCGRDSLKRSGLRVDRRKRSGKLLLCEVANGTGLFLSVHVNDTKMARKMRNLEPMWKRLKENTLMEKLVSVSRSSVFGMHSNVNVNQTKISSTETQNMFESLTSARAVEKLLG